MIEARLDTTEQIREFLAGTTDVAFAIPTDESRLRTFVATVIKRFGYFRLAKSQRGVLFNLPQFDIQPFERRKSHLVFRADLNHQAWQGIRGDGSHRLP